ncbi:hypothetical protein [Zobellella sp. An-6]|uniref:hypothetical protein n=1 Tax=Zobellella sp. An-6 TaxID=3400218 RepID=UPI004041CA61
MKKTTIVEIAERAGVGRATVDRVLEQAASRRDGIILFAPAHPAVATAVNRAAASTSPCSPRKTWATEGGCAPMGE